jgi:uncharacterized protein (TIGR02757 family)
VKAALDRLYASFNYPESALDPIQIVRRYPAVADREIVAFVAAGLAFGRVASVMASVEAVCAVLGPEPAAFVRRFDPRRDAPPLEPIVHRWIRGRDITALIWILRSLIERHGSLEGAMASGLASAAQNVEGAIEHLANEGREVDLEPVYGRRPRPAPGVSYFLSRPSTGSACKRINLFLRWMVRNDAVDPGGWSGIAPSQLVVPLDTHTIRTGRCLGLTGRASPGWKMAVEITEALRALDPLDPVRYDFALCHLGMMGACGWHANQGDTRCPLRGLCRPKRRTKARSATARRAFRAGDRAARPGKSST